MLWKEKGVLDGSCISFFSVDQNFADYFYHMISCGFFICQEDYHIANRGPKPPLFMQILNGSLNVRYEDSEFEAPKKSVVLLNCEKGHQYYCTDSAEFIFFHFGGPEAYAVTDRLIADNGGCPVFRSAVNERIYNDISKIVIRQTFEDQYDTETLSALIYQSLCMLRYSLHQRRNILKESAENSAVDEAIRYIRKHISEVITLDDLADCAGMSPYHFSRLFRKNTGHSPIEYVYTVKNNYAKLMLRTTDASVSEIADYLGFSSDASFINSFKARNRITPLRYRKTAEYNPHAEKQKA